MDMEDARCVFRHLSYMANRESTDKFFEVAHVRYDTAIRKRAMVEGFWAFKLGDTEYLVVHYSFENLKAAVLSLKAIAISHICLLKRASAHTTGLTKRPDVTDEEKCGFWQWCAKCGSKYHNHRFLVLKLVMSLSVIQ